MKNLWKGLAVGAFVSAAGGEIRDLIDTAGSKSAEVAGRVHDDLPRVADRAKTHAAELIDHARDELPNVAATAKADVAALAAKAHGVSDRRREVLPSLVERTRENARHVAERVTEAGSE